MKSVSPSKESSIATHQKSVFQCPECEYEANRKGNLASLSTRERSFNAQSVSMQQLKKVILLPISSLSTRDRSFSAQHVNMLLL